MNKIMDVKVRVYYDNKLITQKDLNKISIKNPNVDRIVNDIIKRNTQQER